MHALSRPARWYLYGIWATSLVAICYALLTARLPYSSPLLLLAALVAFLLADVFSVNIAMNDRESAQMTVADTILIFLTAVTGGHGVLVTFVGSFLTDLFLGRPWFKGLFNASQRSLCYLALVATYSLINGPGLAPFNGWRGLLALIVMVILYFVLNPLFVAGIVALASRQPVLSVYAASLRQFYWIHLITLPLGAVLAVIWAYQPWLIIPGIVPLIMAYRSFQTIASLQAESRRSKVLAHHARELAARLERLQDTTTAMLATLEPQPLLRVVSGRLAVLLNARAAWALLLEDTPQLVMGEDLLEPQGWDASAYVAELQHHTVRQLDGEAVRVLHSGNTLPWPTLLLIPMLTGGRLIGGFCLALDHQPTLADDDRRVLIAFAAQAALTIERAQLYDQLRGKQEQLIRSSKLAALGTFAAGIAHEFNNLLTAVSGFAQLGLSSDDVAEKNEALEVALRTSVRGQSITSGLLTFARRRDARRESTQLQNLVEETLALIERELTKANVHVLRDYQPVPPTICDPGQIAQVVMNLLTNARDAMAEQRGGTLTVALTQHDNQIELRVSDTGSGIAPELLAQIFEPFMTTKGALGSSTVPGTGLGLAISQSIVEGHGGTIAVTSTVGHGTTMAVRLPVIGVQERTPPTVVTTVGPEQLRMLVVDDEVDVAESLRRLLSRYGFVVVVALDGQEALDRYREQPFDVVLTDAIMTGMGGPAFLSNLIALDPRAHVLVMTGHPRSVEAEQMLQSGALAVLGKPFVTDELVTAVRHYAAHSGYAVLRARDP